MRSWSWIDIFSLLLTLTICGGVIYVVTQIIYHFSQSMANTKQSLKSKGLTISRTGVSVKTDKRFDREEYYAATSRGIMKAYNASTFGNKPEDPIDRPEYHRTGSAPSIHPGAQVAPTAARMGATLSVPGAQHGSGKGAASGTDIRRSASVGRSTHKRNEGKGVGGGDGEKERGRAHFMRHGRNKSAQGVRE